MSTGSASPAIVPFSEPPYLCGLPSPYYNESHLKFQRVCRAFVSEHLLELALEWDKQETLPVHVFETFARAGMLLPSLPAPLPVGWLRRLGINEILGINVEEFDYMHNLIYSDEVSVP